MIDADGTIYMGSDDGYVYAINPNGTLRERHGTTDAIYSSPSISETGMLYFGTDDGFINALDVSSGGIAVSPWPKFRCNVQNTGKSTRPGCE